MTRACVWNLLIQACRICTSLFICAQFCSFALGFTCLCLSSSCPSTLILTYFHWFWLTCTSGCSSHQQFNHPTGIQPEKNDSHITKLHLITLIYMCATNTLFQNHSSICNAILTSRSPCASWHSSQGYRFAYVINGPTHNSQWLHCPLGLLPHSTQYHFISLIIMTCYCMY
jgi:hypothetical protein